MGRVCSTHETNEEKKYRVVISVGSYRRKLENNINVSFFKQAQRVPGS